MLSAGKLIVYATRQRC